MNIYDHNEFDRKLSSSQVLLIILGMIVLAGLLIMKLSGHLIL